MGFLWTLGLLAVLAIMSTILAKIDIRAGRSAYRLLETGIHMAVEPEADLEGARGQQKVRRGYISPYTKKLIGARQRWRCAVCKRTLGPDFHIDHILPLFKGGDNSMENLQALCPTDHTMKSAIERA